VPFVDAQLSPLVEFMSGLDAPRHRGVHGGLHISATPHATAKRDVADACSGVMTPACVASAYGIASSFVQTGVSQGVASLETSGFSNNFSPSDLSTFQSEENVGAQDTFSVVSVMQGTNDASTCTGKSVSSGRSRCSMCAC
jgi:hypothetical protein